MSGGGWVESSPELGGAYGKQIRVFDPTITPKEQALRYAPRPTSLQGKKVGLVENTKYNSDTLLLRKSVRSSRRSTEYKGCS